MAKMVHVTVPEDLFEAVDKQAKIEARPRSSIFREAIRVYIAIKRLERTQLSGKSYLRSAPAERLLRDNVVAFNSVAEAQGVTEEDLLRLGREVREEVYRDRYGSER